MRRSGTFFSHHRSVGDAPAAATRTFAEFLSAPHFPPQPRPRRGFRSLTARRPPSCALGPTCASFPCGTPSCPASLRRRRRCGRWHTSQAVFCAAPGAAFPRLLASCRLRLVRLDHQTLLHAHKLAFPTCLQRPDPAWLKLLILGHNIFLVALSAFMSGGCGCQQGTPPPSAAVAAEASKRASFLMIHPHLTHPPGSSATPSPAGTRSGGTPTGPPTRRARGLPSLTGAL